jgi:hypothetical protein
MSKREKGKKVTASRKKTGYFVGLVAALLMTVLMWMAGAALTAPPAHASLPGGAAGTGVGQYAPHQQAQSNGGPDDLIGAT